MEPDTNPAYAIDQIDSFLSKIDDLQQMDCENPDSEREKTKLEINIRGFLRTYFKDDDKKLKDLEKDRSSYLTKHFFDPDGAVKRQKEYENDFEIIKYHLIAYKTELESINNSRRKAVLPTQPKRITKKTSANPPILKKQTSKEKSLDNRKIFIVHGHDHVLLEKVEQYLESLDLEPIVLHKQADLGKTIIEKVEHYVSQTSFAIVILTKDDFGISIASDVFQSLKNSVEFRISEGLLSEIRYGSNLIEYLIESEDSTVVKLLEGFARGMLKDMKPRARQNVIFELGITIGHLGRDRVRVLYEEDVELPTDIHGLAYTPLKRDWKKKLAQEINAAGIKIDEKFL